MSERPDLGFIVAQWLGANAEQMIVGSCEVDSPAERSGIMAGDCVTVIDGKPPLEFLRSDWWPRSDDTPIRVTLTRDGRQLSRYIELPEVQASEISDAASASSPMFPAALPSTSGSERVEAAAIPMPEAATMASCDAAGAINGDEIIQRALAHWPCGYPIERWELVDQVAIEGRISVEVAQRIVSDFHHRLDAEKAARQGDSAGAERAAFRSSFVANHHEHDHRLGFSSADQPYLPPPSGEPPSTPQTWHPHIRRTPAG